MPLPFSHPLKHPGAWLRHLLLDLCRHADGDVRRLPSTPAQSIHALRVRMKKLRALVRLVEPRLPAGTCGLLCRRIRYIKNAFASSRDTAVMQKLAWKIGQLDRLPPVVLAGAMQTTGDETTETCPRFAMRVRRQIVSLHRQIARIAYRTLRQEEIIDAYVRCYGAGRRLLKHCADEGTPERFHRWRKRVKELYYLSLALHRLPQARKLIRPAEQLGRRLGQVHDLDVMEARLVGPSEDDWRHSLNKRQQKLRRRVFADARKLFAEPRRKLQRGLLEQAAGV